jgi:hypothetical protein
MLIKFSVGNPESKRPLQIARKIILNLIINKLAMRAWICYVVIDTLMNLWVTKNAGIFLTS